jgi:protein-disulfide isomerase
MKQIVLLAAGFALLATSACHKADKQTGNTVNEVKPTQSAPQPGAAWDTVINATADGVMMGNPNAKVKLVEIASLGCPFCKRFDDEGVPTLIEQYVKAGKVSWEFRAYIIHGPVDMAANLIAHCNGPKTFFPLALAMYKDQPTWMGKVESAPKEKLAQIESMPINQAYAAMADLTGLQDWAAARGVPHAKSSQCLSDQKMIDHEAQVSVNVTDQYPDFKGTPSFVLNGQLLDDAGTWAKLRPQLDAALN